MTDESINLLLDRLNKQDIDGIVIRPISEWVWWGYAWDAIEEKDTADSCTFREGCEFYFIKSDDGLFAAAVHRFGPEEMHWFVADSHRGKGLLLQPLKQIILPHIFWRNETLDSQRGSVNLRRAWAVFASKLIEKSGFQKVSETDAEAVYEIRRSSVPAYEPIPYSVGIDEGKKELEALTLSVRKQIRSLRIILDVLKVKYGNSVRDEKIKNLRCDTTDLSQNILDTIHFDARFNLGSRIRE